MEYILSKRLFALATALAFALVTGCTEPAPEPVALASDPTFVGSPACASCHQLEFESWQGSHHQLAMQVADKSAVLGDFSGVEFEYFETATKFFMRDDAFIVQTENADGEEQEFEISHAFGVEPLQQYLVSFPDGRKQALPFAWDTRDAAAGGQRWFHLYPDEYIGPGDELHWTGPNFNWNYMCAECHSTDLQMNYDLATDSFATTWSEISVGCEGCHGPASGHIAQANNGDFDEHFGMMLDLDDHGEAIWAVNPENGMAKRSEPRDTPAQQPESCGRCHSRRSVSAPEYEYGKPLTDTHLPALLEGRLYFADGQILDEVYVYGSFLQSRMYQAGVTCNDCHDPHSTKLVTGANVNSVCGQCHLPTVFSTAEHHGHTDPNVGCVDCHMTTRTYMGVDDRRDHSFRVPHPERSAAIQSPNACANCHADEQTEWFSQAMASWSASSRVASPDFAKIFSKARSGRANEGLVSIISDSRQAGIVRATAIELLSQPLTEDELEAVRMGTDAADPLLRIASLRALQRLPVAARMRKGTALLSDPVRSVRLEAARTYADSVDLLEFEDARAFQRAADEFRQSNAAIQNRPEAHASLGDFERLRGNTSAAMRSYEAAMRTDRSFLPAYLNLADLMRASGDDAAAERLLRDGIGIAPDVAALHHSLGLVLVRTGRTEEALQELRTAADMESENSRYAYVLAIAFNSLGQQDAAIERLRIAMNRFPQDFDIGWALATVLRDAGQLDLALQTAEELLLSYPDDENVQVLIDSLQ